MEDCPILISMSFLALTMTMNGRVLCYHSLLRQMAAQKQTAVKTMKKYPKQWRINKTIKSEPEYIDQN